jgi:predicted  nucleic acid-binding Zn-ribbon protein
MKRLALLALAPLVLAACSQKETARADSAETALARQLELSRQLAAQKDSLTSVVLEADKFISSVDSQIAKVKGLPADKRKAGEDPLQAQLSARQAMLDRVDALVKRTRETASQLAESRRREQTLRGQNAKYKDELENDQKMISELNAAIERQTVTIAGLQTRVDSLSGENVRLGTELASATTALNRAYYVIGTEQELLQKGVVVREGGANLLVKKVGRTLVPARALDQSAFTEIDQRQLAEISVPDSTKLYRVVSRQSLDAAEVAARDAKNPTRFRGNLRIANAEQFWAPSKFLIIVKEN